MVVTRTSRVASLDTYKGLAILLVVAGHLAQSTPDFDNSLLFKGIYMFHMPLFFLVSGMVYSLKPPINSVRGLAVSIAKRARQLLLPFFAWYAVSYVLFQPNIPVSDYLDRLWKSPDVGLWFLWVLFFISSAADIVGFLARAVKIPFLLALIGAWAVLFWLKIGIYSLGVGMMSYQMPFFIAGIFHRQMREGASEYFVKPFVAVCTLAYPFFVCNWVRVNPPELGIALQSKYALPMSSTTYPLYLAIGYAYQIIPAIVGIVVFFVGSKAFTEAGGLNRRASSLICFVGQRTLEIYAIHFYLLQFAYFNASPFANGLVAFVMAPALSIFIADYLLKPNKTAALILFGRK